jgi:hypothetical protein
MSAPVMPAPACEAERLEQLEAAFLRSPSLTWPLPSPDAAVPVEVPLESSEQLAGSEARVSRYNTYGLCCKW